MVVRLREEHERVTAARRLCGRRALRRRERALRRFHPLDLRPDECVHPHRVDTVIIVCRSAAQLDLEAGELAGEDRRDGVARGVDAIGHLPRCAARYDGHGAPGMR